ncbi:MAG: RDD family protein [Rhodocyclaceae bacterium]|nr:RDD family protein [Rhodocyclaceae bacterium]
MSGASQAPLPAAGLRRRLACMLYESFLLIGVLGFAVILPQLLLGMARQSMMQGAWLWLHLFSVLLLYFGWLWKRQGQTLAMQTWKIRLVSANGKALGSRQIVLRYLLAWPSLLLGGIGLLWALADRDRQFLHDRLAGTRLVKLQ